MALGLPVTLYGLHLSAPTYKVALMLSLCGEAFQYRHIDLFKGAHKEPGFLAINRYGQVPALVHGDLTLCQANVILQYLATTTGKFRGQTESERWHVKEWQFWETDRLHPSMGRTRAFVRFNKPDPAVADYFRTMANDALKVLDAQLAGRTYLVGDKATIADIACFGTIAHAEEANIDITAFPNISAWRSRMQKLPGHRAPYDLLPQADVA